MSTLTHGLLAILLLANAATFVVALRRRSWAAVVNSLVSVVLAVSAAAVATTLLPLAWNAVAAPELALWVSVAGLLHSVGMLGPYDSVWWWDHLTHTVSAALVAALVYAGLVVAVDTGVWPFVSSATTPVLTVLFTFGIGVAWEVVELVSRGVGELFDVEPVLVHYGWRDTALDLVFDVVGAVLVVVLDVRIFVEAAARVPETVGASLVWTSGTILVSAAVMASAVLQDR